MIKDRNNPINQEVKQHNVDGSKTNFYDVRPNKDGFVDVDRITEELNMHFFAGNVLKSLFGISIALNTNKTRHKGTSIKRDINKLKHYVDKYCNMIENYYV